MDQQLPMALQVVLYSVSGAVVVLGAVLVHVCLRFDKKLDRVATAMERLEAELTPLTREVRVVVDRLGELSQRVQGQWVAWEGASAALRSPLLAFNRTTRILRTGAAAFFGALWNGRGPAKPNARARWPRAC